MAKFRKKPVEIEAVKLERNHKSFQEVYFFMKWYTHTSSKMGEEKWYQFVEDKLKADGILIPTLEGNMLAMWGDWVIQEPFPTGDRDFYPCKPDIFIKTYDAVL